MAEKKQLREKIKAQLHSLTVAERIKKNSQILTKLWGERAWCEAKTVATYVSIGQEVDTRQLIERAWCEKKRVVVPKVTFETKEMQFYELTSFSQLEETMFQLQEPITARCAHVFSSDIDFMIVPGLAFTKEGDRLGYGGGFYDRYLATYNGKTLALAYDIQLVEKIPLEPYDERVHILLTESARYERK